jgi:hypothetical protein
VTLLVTTHNNLLLEFDLNSQFLREMECYNNQNKFEIETVAWLFQASCTIKTKESEDFTCVMDLDCIGKMSSIARILRIS